METMTVIINWNSASIGTLGGLAALLGLTAQPPNDLSRWSVHSWEATHMRPFARYALSVSAAAALLAGCGGSVPPIGAPGAMQQSRAIVTHTKGSGSWITPKASAAVMPEYSASGPLLYVANFDSPPYDGVTVYDADENDPAPLAVINANIFEPGGDCVGADGVLYVANAPGSGLGWVSEYALGMTKTLRVITKGIDIPSFCAIDGSGNLWVTNVGSSTATEYLKGSTVPHFTLKNGLTNPDGIAIDHAGNIYVGNLNAPYAKSNVQVYRPNKKSPSRTITDGITWPVGIAVDAEATLYVTNDISPCNIEKYRAGESHPYQKITKDIDGPTDVTFSPSGRLYEVNEGSSDCASNGPAPVILEFRPHLLSPTKRIIGKDLHTPVGATYYPPSLP
jgi:hypothetical protein